MEDTEGTEDMEPQANTTEAAPRARRTPPISKSAAAALACEYHFAGVYISPDPALRRIATPAATIGQQFHEYRRAYIEHLQWSEVDADEAWVADYIERTPLVPDARAMIRRDAERFRIDRASLIGPEVYLSLDADLEPLDLIPGAQYGKMRPQSGAAVTGFVDLLQRRDNAIIATDYKTAWNAAHLDEYEAIHYALLLLRHYPDAATVIWTWYLPRTGAHIERQFQRFDEPMLAELVAAKIAERDTIIRKLDAGEQLAANPFSGLCVFCPLECPLRAALSAGTLTPAIGPIQSPEDAERIAALIQIGSDTLAKARNNLKTYLAEHGALELPNGYIAEMVEGTSTEYPAGRTLEALGFQISGNPRWDIDLDKITLNGTKLKSLARAKSRAGMAEAIAAAAVNTPSSDLRIRKQEAIEISE